MATFNPLSAGSSLDATIQALQGDLSTDTSAATSQLESWLRLLDGTGPGAQGAISQELANLKHYIGRADSANISHSLQTLGKLTAKAADAGTDEEISSKLHRLGEALTALSTALPG
ncbi:hypothetical protein [uncultured Hymenobacter sp.]|uniref:hypothetical protein n=1 Tax=uncultured Hymenobacter sp. TaxID=170016 RepID=UPI0035C962C2